MKRTPRTNGRLGLLATPLITAAFALALSACGSPASAGNSSSAGNSASSGTPAATGSSAATGTSAVSSTSAPGQASSAAFCEIWQETRTTLSMMNAIMSNSPAFHGMSTSASVLLPTMQAIDRVFGRLDQVAPPAVSADMSALTSFWSQVVADFKYGTTVGQVKAYLKAHPPSNAGTINASMQQLSGYLTNTCHINVSS